MGGVEGSDDAVARAQELERQLKEATERLQKQEEALRQQHVMIEKLESQKKPGLSSEETPALGPQPSQSDQQEGHDQHPRRRNSSFIAHPAPRLRLSDIDAVPCPIYAGPITINSPLEEGEESIDALNETQPEEEEQQQQPDEPSSRKGSKASTRRGSSEELRRSIVSHFGFGRRKSRRKSSRGMKPSANESFKIEVVDDQGETKILSGNILEAYKYALLAMMYGHDPIKKKQTFLDNIVEGAVEGAVAVGKGVGGVVLKTGETIIDTGAKAVTGIADLVGSSKKLLSAGSSHDLPDKAGKERRLSSKSSRSTRRSKRSVMFDDLDDLETKSNYDKDEKVLEPQRKILDGAFRIDPEQADQLYNWAKWTAQDKEVFLYELKKGLKMTASHPYFQEDAFLNAKAYSKWRENCIDAYSTHIYKVQGYQNSDIPSLLGTLEVQIIGADNLYHRDQVLNPYCTLNLTVPNDATGEKSQIRKTKTVQDSTCPDWDEEFSFFVYHKTGVLLSVDVWDSPSLSIDFDFGAVHSLGRIGRVVVPISSFLETKMLAPNEWFETWYPLECPGDRRQSLPSGASYGRIHLKILYKEDDAAVNHHLFLKILYETLVTYDNSQLSSTGDEETMRKRDRTATLNIERSLLGPDCQWIMYQYAEIFHVDDIYIHTIYMNTLRKHWCYTPAFLRMAHLHLESLLELCKTNPIVTKREIQSLFDSVSFIYDEVSRKLMAFKTVFPRRSVAVLAPIMLLLVDLEGISWFREEAKRRYGSEIEDTDVFECLENVTQGESGQAVCWYEGEVAVSDMPTALRFAGAERASSAQTLCDLLAFSIKQKYEQAVEQIQQTSIAEEEVVETSTASDGSGPVATLNQTVDFYDGLTVIHWEKDEDVRECRSCQKQFTFIRRKHHCRRCGKIFCHACSDNQRPVRIQTIDKYGTGVPLQFTVTEVRVCDNCCTYEQEDDKAEAPDEEDNTTRVLTDIQLLKLCKVVEGMWNDDRQFVESFPKERGVDLAKISLETYYASLAGELEVFCKKNANEPPTPRVLDLYNTMKQIHTELVECNPEFVNEIMFLLHHFYPLLKKWMDETTSKMVVWTFNALETDQWQPQNEEYLHSSSVIDVFWMIKESISTVFNLRDVSDEGSKTFNVFMGILSNSISSVLLKYSQRVFEYCAVEGRAHLETGDEATEFNVTSELCVRVNNLHVLRENLDSILNELEQDSKFEDWDRSNSELDFRDTFVKIKDNNSFLCKEIAYLMNVTVYRVLLRLVRGQDPAIQMSFKTQGYSDEETVKYLRKKMVSVLMCSSRQSRASITNGNTAPPRPERRRTSSKANVMEALTDYIQRQLIVLSNSLYYPLFQTVLRMIWDLTVRDVFDVILPTMESQYVLEESDLELALECSQIMGDIVCPDEDTGVSSLIVQRDIERLKFLINLYKMPTPDIAKVYVEPIIGMSQPSSPALQPAEISPDVTTTAHEIPSASPDREGLDSEDAVKSSTPTPSPTPTPPAGASLGSTPPALGSTPLALRTTPPTDPAPQVPSVPGKKDETKSEVERRLQIMNVLKGRKNDFQAGKVLKAMYDTGIEEVDVVYEHERAVWVDNQPQWSPSNLTKMDPPNLSNTAGVASKKETWRLPDQTWCWGSDWKVDLSKVGPRADADGWEYSVDFKNYPWSRHQGFTVSARRRMWIRQRRKYEMYLKFPGH